MIVTEPLERRLLLAATVPGVRLESRTLVVDGAPDAANVIAITVDAFNVTVDLNGTTFEAATPRVKRLRVTGGSLADDVTVTDPGGLLAAAKAKISLGGGDDTAVGIAGKNVIDGGSGNDTLAGGAARDVIHGGAGNDTLRGSAGKDRLLGESGADALDGGEGADKLFGGPGSDNALVGGLAGNADPTTTPPPTGVDDDASRDRLTGGPGADVLEFSAVDHFNADALDQVPDQFHP